MYIEFTGIKMYTKYKIVPFCPYQFVRTILSNTILSIPFCPYHFVRTILSATILSYNQIYIYNIEREREREGDRRTISWFTAEADLAPLGSITMFITFRQTHLCPNLTC